MLRGSAMPVPAMSKAVPWSTEVRITGRPTVMFTPASMPEHLDRAVALVVVHRHDQVVVAAAGEEEQRVGRQRARSRRCRRPARPRRRVDLLRLLAVAEQPVLAGVRVDAADADLRVRDAGATSASWPRRMVRSTRPGSILRDGVDEPDVRGHVDDPDLRRGEHHRDFLACR